MSKKKNTTDTEIIEVSEEGIIAPADETAAEEAKKPEKAEEKTGPVVYCGPSIRGIARQYTVYTGPIPKDLEAYAKEHPTIRSLIVPTEKFAETRKKLESAGTPEALLYKKIKSEM